MRRFPRAVVAIVGVLAIVLVGYLAYVGYEGSRQAVSAEGADPRCDTPDVQFGWSYAAINYDAADDARLGAENPDRRHCRSQGEKAGAEIVTTDGIRIAGWYVPAANGSGPAGPTVILVHGFKATKAGILQYAKGLHAAFNLVAFDLRNAGRSTGTATTAGVFEQHDVRAIIDWLERAKGPARIGLLGNSLGAATALAEARDDPRIDAFVFDSLHTRLSYQLRARVAHAGYPAFFATDWAIIVGTWLRTGADIGSIDAVDTATGLHGRPVLLIHGTADEEDLPDRTQAFYESLRSMGVPAELEWCPGSGHLASAGMPVDVCPAEFDRWVSDFFTRTLS